jgi:hypothetical protein
VITCFLNIDRYRLIALEINTVAGNVAQWQNDYLAVHAPESDP